MSTEEDRNVNKDDLTSTDLIDKTPNETKNNLIETVVEKQSDNSAPEPVDKADDEDATGSEDRPIVDKVDETITTDKATKVAVQTETKSITNNTVATAAAVEVNTDEIYTVEALLKSRVRKNKGVEHKEYLVKWKGEFHNMNIYF